MNSLLHKILGNEVYSEEDKKLIDSLKVKIKSLETVIDEDYHAAKDARNTIISEIQQLHRRSTIRLEKWKVYY